MWKLIFMVVLFTGCVDAIDVAVTDESTEGQTKSTTEQFELSDTQPGSTGKGGGPLPYDHYCGDRGNCQLGQSGQAEVCRPLCGETQAPFHSTCWNDNGVGHCAFIDGTGGL